MRKEQLNIDEEVSPEHEISPERSHIETILDILVELNAPTVVDKNGKILPHIQDYIESERLDEDLELVKKQEYPYISLGEWRVYQPFGQEGYSLIYNLGHSDEHEALAQEIKQRCNAAGINVKSARGRH